MDRASPPWRKRGPLGIRWEPGGRDSREDLPSHCGHSTAPRHFQNLALRGGRAPGVGTVARGPHSSLPGQPCSFVVWDGAEWAFPATLGSKPLAWSLFLEPRAGRSEIQAVGGAGRWQGAEEHCPTRQKPVREQPARTPASQLSASCPPCHVPRSQLLVNDDGGWRLAAGIFRGESSICSLAAERKTARSPAAGLPQSPVPVDTARGRPSRQEVSCGAPEDWCPCTVLWFPRVPGPRTPYCPASDGGVTSLLQPCRLPQLATSALKTES